MHQRVRQLKIELLQLLREERRRQEIEIALRAGAVVVDNADGSVTVIKIQFLQGLTAVPLTCRELEG
jgi:hypothetical protein